MHICILRISILSTTVGSDLCDPCDPSASSCTSPLVCSSDTNRCECPSGQVQIGDECCKFEIIKANLKRYTVYILKACAISTVSKWIITVIIIFYTEIFYEKA